MRWAIARGHNGGQNDRQNAHDVGQVGGHIWGQDVGDGHEVGHSWGT